MPDISVITCTHNPRSEFLEATVRGLANQSLPAAQWEYVLIDNASSQERLPKASLSWHPDARTFREAKLGLTPARLRGIHEAKGELLVFVDDDNVLDPDFLDQALRVAKERPYLGSWSGQIRPEFAVPPPEWTRRYWGNLAIREFEQDLWSNQPRLPDTMPCGAGLCVRREVAAHYVRLHEIGQRSFQFDRTGDSLVSGGDNDLAACACDIGLGVGLIAALKLTHLMPPERLTCDYLARLAEGIAFSSVLLDAARNQPVVRRGFLRTGADRIRAWALPAPHRRIAYAAMQGRRRALQVLSQVSKP